MRGGGRASRSFLVGTPNTTVRPINFPRAPGARRWNSPQSSPYSASRRGGEAAPFARQSGRVGWKTTSVVTLVVGTGLLGFGLATLDAKRREAREREYSSERKFKEPAYADLRNLKDVSVVSLGLSNFLFGCLH
jgi:hypothetical protein